MDARATEVLSALRNPNLSIEAKITYLTKLKSDIKRENIPEASIPLVFDALKIAIPSQSLAAAGFSTLGHVLKRLYLQQEHRAIALQGRQMYPLLLDRLGDHRERIRSQAAQAFSDFWAASHSDVESYVLEGALVGKNPRAKEASMIWLANMTRDRGLLFRTYVPRLVACLEDADAGVRETAKTTVIELFQNAPPKAQSDLKKQLQLHNVRKSIVSSILSSIGAGDDSSAPSQSQSRPESLRPASSLSSRREGTRPASAMSTNSHTDVPGKTKTLGNHDPSDPYSDLEVATKPSKKEGATSQSEGPDIAAPSDTDGEAIEPYHVHSHREFDDLILDMMPHFEGRETEQNWLLRERSVRLLRRLTKGNAPHDFPQYYLPAIKSLLDGILKAVNSLRTTLSTVGCLLVQEIARTVGNAIDPWVEILLQNMLKVCGALKKITSQNGNATVEAIVANASYSHRLMQHMWWACEDKNVQPRLYATNWLRIIINTHIPAHRGALEHGGGLDIIEKCVKKGLADPNPGVREAMRSTFWVFYKAWKERGEEIIESLDAKSRNLLEKDPGNPNGTKQPQASKSRANSHSAATSRPTLKETIAAQKRARLAAQKSAASSAASRPESEASVYSEHTKAPVHSAPPPTTASQPKPTRPGQMRAHATTSSGVPGGILSSAPLRPGQRSKRPEQPRPMVDTNTRKNGHGDSGDTSPSGSPTRYYPQSQPRSRIGTAVTPGRPKSRLETSPDRSREHRAAPTASSVPPRPKRLDIASLKGDGRAALVAHAGNALSPKVIMSPAIDDDVFGQYENTEPPLPPLPPQPKQYPLAPAPRLRDVEMRDEQMEGEQHVDAIPAHDEREEAAQVPLSDSSFVSPEPQHQPQPQPQAIDIGSPKSVRSVGASSIAMSTRGTSTPPRLNRRDYFDSPSRIPISPRYFSPARDIRSPPTGVAAFGPASPSPASRRPRSSRGGQPALTQENIAGLVSPPSVSASRRLAAVTHDENGFDEQPKDAGAVPQLPDRRFQPEEEPVRPSQQPPMPESPSDAVMLGDEHTQPQQAATPTKTTTSMAYDRPQSPSPAPQERHRASREDRMDISPPRVSQPVKPPTPLEDKAQNEAMATRLSLPTRTAPQQADSPRGLSPSPFTRSPADSLSVQGNGDRERGGRLSITPGKKGRDLSPRSRDPVYALRMIDSAMRKINTGSAVDLLSFKKLQMLITYHHTSIFRVDNSNFNTILSSLCAALASPLPYPSTPAEAQTNDFRERETKALGVKKQCLNTIRTLARVEPQLYSTCHVEVLKSLVVSSTYFEETDHVLGTVETCMEDIVSTCDVQAALGGVVDLLQQQRHDEQYQPQSTNAASSHRMYIFGANVIEQLLTRLNMEGVTLENEALVRSLGFIADEMFSHHETGVRQAAKGLLISLHKVVPSEDMFWDLMGKQHQGRNLLTYYIATSERRNVNV